jgi:NhaA family Na+:H+ antiporter
MMAESASPSQDKVPGAFTRFVHSEVTGSIFLLACTIIALAWANSPWSAAYFELARTKISVSWGEAELALSLKHWINDGLMALFFFVVGLEIKREVAVGQLSSPRKAVLPVTAAFGGMAVPALLYIAFNAGGSGAPGWGVPMATDIAFALGLLALFGSRAAVGLKVFLTALAIADDLGAVLVIALFYTETIHWAALGLAGLLLLLLFGVGRLRVRGSGIYIILALGVWGAVLASGVHATVAGILVAFLVPMRARIEPSLFLETAGRRLKELATMTLSRESMISDKQQLEQISEIHLASGDMRPPGLTLEHHCHPILVFFVLPLFALFNAGIELGGGAMSALGEPVGLGIIAGLVLGKPLGILAFSWLAVRSGWADLPRGVDWGQIAGAGCLAGIGFTMSLFISEMAFSADALVQEAKMGILAASLVAGLAGYLLLRWRFGTAQPRLNRTRKSSA